jgi:hypothetical protein
MRYGGKRKRTWGDENEEAAITTNDAFARVTAAGYESLAVRKADRGHYWAHRPEHETFYYWEEMPVSRGEYIAAMGEDLPRS